MPFTATITDPPYNCPTDGTSDVMPAFLAWKADAQGLSSVLNVPAHTYNTKANADRFPFDIGAPLIVQGAGAGLTVFTDDGGSGSISFGTAVAVSVASPQKQARIQSVAAGSSLLVLKTLADNTIFPSNRWIATCAYDLQGGGSDPPNPFYFEYAQIGVNPGTGIIPLATPLQYSYLSTFPNYDPGSSGQPDEGGPATIYLMPANWGNFDTQFRDLTIDINGTPLAHQILAKGRLVHFHNVPITGAGTLIPSCNQTFMLSGPSTVFPGGEFDKMIETVIVEDGATINQPVIQSSCGPNLIVVDTNGRINTQNGTPRKMIVRNGASIGTLKLGALGYGRADEYEQTGGTISSITYQPPQYAMSGYSAIGNAISRAHSTGPIPFGMPQTNLMFSGPYTSMKGTRVASVSDDGTTTRLPTGLIDGFPASTTSLGPHPCPLLRLSGVTGCAEAIDYSQPGAYNKPLYSYSKRFYNGLTGDGNAVLMWGKLTSITVNVTSAAAGTLKVLGHFDNFPTLKNDNTVFSYAPTVDLSVPGIHVITPPEDLWFTGFATPFCAATTAIFSIEMITDQGMGRAFACSFQ